ncbi:MAG: hypothetical protein ACTSQH_01535 [Candidatus Hodarchaeales archaeon]
MTNKIIEHHLSRNVPIFVRAKEIIDKENIFSIEDIVSVIEELTEYEEEIRTLRQRIFEATYTDVLSELVEPIKELFEEESKSL